MKRGWLLGILMMIVMLSLLSCDVPEEACIHVDEDVSVIDPTCDREGYTLHVCRSCKTEYKTDFKTPLGHTLAEKKILPTCESTGYTQYSCECGYRYEGDFVAPKGHSFEMTVERLPTSDQNGVLRQSCSCGLSYTELAFSSDVYGAYVETDTVFAYGVDVSYYQGEVDWQKLVDAGIDYVIIRAGYTTQKDPMFEEYYRGAKAAGLGVGCYYYMGITEEAARTLTDEELLLRADVDAEEFLSWMEGKQFDYPVYLDMEDLSFVGIPDDSEDELFEPVSAQILTDMCHRFIRKVQSEGYYCGLYVNNNWLVNYLKKDELTQYYDVWYSRYPSTAEWRFPADGLAPWLDKFGTRTGMWQFTANGVVGTHSGLFDLNVSFKNYQELIRFYGYNGYGETK